MMDHPNDKNRNHAAFEVSDLQKAQFRQEAMRMYAQLDTQEKIDRALNPLIHPSPISRLWAWTRARIGSFVNMLKVATMSVFLGRAATDKRLNEGNRNAEKQEKITDARKEAKIQVLNEKKAALEKESAIPEKDGDRTASKQPSQEMEKEPSAEQESQKQNFSQEQPQNEIQLMKPNETILSLQIAKMTEQYQRGFLELLQRESGLEAESIQVANSITKNGKSCIQVTMELNPGIMSQIRIDEHGRYLGNTKEMTAEEKRICGDIRKLLLYYTAREYVPSKDKELYDRTGYKQDGRILRATEHNKNTLRPGTTLTRKDFLRAFQTATERGYVNYFDFGHILSVKQENGRLSASIDGQTIDLSMAKDYKDGVDILHNIYAAKIKEDYDTIESGIHALTQSIDIYKESTKVEETIENQRAGITQEGQGMSVSSQDQIQDTSITQENIDVIPFEDYEDIQYEEMLQEFPPYEAYDFDQTQIVTPLNENGCPVQIEMNEQEPYENDQELYGKEQALEEQDPER